MYNYAKDVLDLSNEDLSVLKKVKIIGKHSLEFGYPHAKGRKGYLIEERTLKHDTPAYKIFTGSRIWIIPQDDLQEI